jgi:beta-glucosidase
MMKRLNIICIALALAMIAGACSQEKAPGVSKSGKDSFDIKVEKLLAQMSLEEKAGQMTQLDIRNLLNDGYGNKDQKLDPEKLKEAVVTYKVGSLLNCIHAYTPEKWHELITQIQEASQNTPNKIPVLYGTDAMHGATFVRGAVLFPHNIGMAASRNDALVYRASEITAAEGRASGLTWNFSPVLDVGREPLWARFEETFGEDVYLTTQMGSAAIRGMENAQLGDKKTMAACMKHYIGYSAPKNGIDRTPALIPEITLREYFLPPFTEAVKNGVATVMFNSGEINGIPTHANKWLLTDVLRGELGFQGLGVSDWEDIQRLYTWQKVASSPKEAVAMAVNAGVDMSMVPNDYTFPELLIENVKDGSISMARIDEAVGRILKLKFRLGLFDDPFPKKEDLEQFGKPEYYQSALDAARESITLLENKNDVLPLKAGTKVLLAGPCADNITTLNSAWSYTWQGNVDSLYPASAKTIRQALAERIGAQNVISNANKSFGHADNYSTAFIQNNAAKADVIVLCLGEDAYAEQPGVIEDLNLQEEQRALIAAAKKTGKKVIVVLVEGRPRLFPKEAPLADAVVLAYRPGNAGGQALSEILLGDVNPSGILPFTYHKYTGKITLYDHKFKDTEQQLAAGESDYEAFQPQWEFGHGLSYTKFEFSGLKTDKKEFGTNDSVKVSVQVKNVGAVAGKVAVDLFSNDHFASITPSVKRLRKYTKIELQPQESKEVVFYVNKEDLKFVGQDMKWVTEAGSFDLIVKDLKTEIVFKP